MAEFTIKVTDDDSAVDIAIKAFNGTPTNRRLWQWYLNHMALQEGSVEKAESEFSDWVRFIANTLAADGTPDANANMKHIHARAFHRFLSKMCKQRYGDLTVYTEAKQ